MVSATNLRFFDMQFQHQTTTGVWRWTTRVDMTGVAPVYVIRDIIAPFGLLRDSVPIPGLVVQAMSSSITQLQANFPPGILIGPPTTLTFIVDEGRGFSLPQTVPVANNGVFGSLLNAVISSSALHTTVTPSNVGNLASNEAGSFDVAVNSTSLLAVSSPYSATITVSDATATNNPRTVPVTITVRPKATILASTALLTFTAARPISGPFDPVVSQTFTIQNTGSAGSVLEYQVQKLTGLSTAWFPSMTPTSGSLNAAASQVVTVNIAPTTGMGAGTYSETVRISGYSTNTYVDVVVQLVIT